jgi:hypothetical protein
MHVSVPACAVPVVGTSRSETKRVTASNLRYIVVPPIRKRQL